MFAVIKTQHLEKFTLTFHSDLKIELQKTSQWCNCSGNFSQVGLEFIVFFAIIDLRYFHNTFGGKAEV